KNNLSSKQKAIDLLKSKKVELPPNQAKSIKMKSGSKFIMVDMRDENKKINTEENQQDSTEDKQDRLIISYADLL
ncbi:MAG: hypothetical protein MHPSP_004557, partial [Paramarteilia canceri]